MDSRVLEVWRTTWPKAIPAHEYETALQMAALVGIAGREPERAAPPLPKAVPAKIAETDLITAPEAAKILGISVQTVYVWAKVGKLRSHQSERGLAFNRRELRRGMPKPRLVHSRDSDSDLPPGMVSMSEAARELGMHITHVHRMIRNGRLSATSLVVVDGRNRRVIARTDLDAFKAARAAP